MFSVLGPSLPLKPMLSEPVEHPSPQTQRQSPIAEAKSISLDRIPSNLPSILDMRLHEWVDKLTNPHDGAFPNGMSPKQMETLAHAQWAAAIRAGRNVRPSWRGSNHLSALLSNEVRAGRLLRLQKACYTGCDTNVRRRLAQNRSAASGISCVMCRHPIEANQGVSLKCKGCGMNVHAECAYNQRRVPMALLAGSKQWPETWHCLNCKRCNICGGLDKKEGLLCRNCDSMEHVRCQRSFSVDTSYRFWSCSLCAKAADCASHATMLHPSTGINADTRSALVVTISTPDNPQAGSSPFELKQSPNEEKQMRDGSDFQNHCYPCGPRMRFYQQSQFLPQAPLGQNPVLTLEDTINRKFLGLPAPPANKEVENPVSTREPSSQSNPVETVVAPACDFSFVASVKTWSTDQVATFFRELGYPESAAAFKNEEIDGAALLIMERADIFSRLGLKVGPALKTYNAIRRLQKAFNRTKTARPPAYN